VDAAGTRDPSGSEAPDPPLERLRELFHARRYADALAAAQALAGTRPANRDLLHLTAVCERQLGRVESALATLERLAEVAPRYSRLHQERGLCHVVRRDAPAAIEALTRAVQLNPALPASWAMLERLYRMTGDADRAANAGAHVAVLARLAPEVVEAKALHSDGDLRRAESLIRNYLLRHGDDVEAMRLLARIALDHEALDDAELLLAEVLERAPDYHPARADLARVLIERHRYPRACAELEKVLERDPGNREWRTLHATASVGLGRLDEAIEGYRKLLAAAPAAADLHLSLAHALKTVGRREEAIEAYRAAAASRPGFGDAYWSLANLKTYRFTDAEIEAAQAHERATGTATVDRYHLCFALGKAFEDRGDYARSWSYYERGNALKRAECGYRPEPVEANTRAQVETCTREFFAARRGSGASDADPIFVVGLPRSGSTLLEQILASHSQVEGTHELAEIPRLALELQTRGEADGGPGYPAVLATLPTEEFRRLGERYLEDTRAYRSGRRYFIDKMPNNFRHVGLIHLMLPNARIIDARREPMACCFGNFKQLFARGQEFSYGVVDVARYYRTYLELMEHWDAVLPGRVLRVLHEDVVEDLEGSVRRLLEFCGLEFEPACVEFHRSRRSVRTASSEQVRQPIYREGLDQWRHYADWLGPLESALGDALEQYRGRPTANRTSAAP
jgi:tetratricopeptide (TPR) repeat protein